MKTKADEIPCIRIGAMELRNLILRIEPAKHRQASTKWTRLSEPRQETANLASKDRVREAAADARRYSTDSSVSSEAPKRRADDHENHHWHPGGKRAVWRADDLSLGDLVGRSRTASIKPR